MRPVTLLIKYIGHRGDLFQAQKANWVEDGFTF